VVMGYILVQTRTGLHDPWAVRAFLALGAGYAALDFAFWRMGAIESCLHLATSRLAKTNGKAALARTPRPAFPSRKSAGSGLLGFHLLVVVVMMAVMLLVVLVMMMMMMMMVVLLRHRSCVRAAGADDRQRDSKGESQPESRQEGLLHDFVSFSARAEFDRHRARSVT